MVHTEIPLKKIAQHRETYIKCIISHNRFPENKMKKTKDILYQNSVSKCLTLFWPREGWFGSSKNQKPTKKPEKLKNLLEKQSWVWIFLCNMQVGRIYVSESICLRAHGLIFKMKMRWSLRHYIRSFTWQCLARSVGLVKQCGNQWLITCNPAVEKIQVLPKI